MTNTLSLYVIYDHPRDFPHSWVVRRHDVRSDGTSVPDRHNFVVAPSLEAARSMLPPGLCNLGRYAEDDPAIAEVWI